MRRDKVLRRQARALAEYEQLLADWAFFGASTRASKERNTAHRAGLTELAGAWEARRQAVPVVETARAEAQAEVQAKLQAQVARNRRNRDLSKREQANRQIKSDRHDAQH